MYFLEHILSDAFVECSVKTVAMKIKMKQCPDNLNYLDQEFSGS